MKNTKNILTYILMALTVMTPVYAADTHPGGQANSIQYNSNAFTNPTFGGLITKNGVVSPSSVAASGYYQISQGLEVDPRAYGATCTGAWYSILTSDLTGGGSGGTGFAPGDTFIISDNTISTHMRGASNATGHVLTVSGSTVLTYAIDYAGTGYYTGLIGPVFVTSGGGSGLILNITSINAAPTKPTVTLNSGGTHWAIGDVFYIPNSTTGNYMTGRVNSVSSGAVLTFTINNGGGDYSTGTGVAATAFAGLGRGLTLNITSATGNAANGTWDDTYGFISAAVAATNNGGAVVEPDQCWGQNVMLPNGTSLVGQGWSPNYGFSDSEVSLSYIRPSNGPHFFGYGVPNFIFDYNNQGGLAFVGFEIRAHDAAAFGSTTCIGSFNGGGGFNYSGVNQARIVHYNMSTKGCAVGVGSTSGVGQFIFLSSFASDYGGNNIAGFYGPLSDLISDNDEFLSESHGIWLSSVAGGFARISNIRTEYLTTGIQLDGGGLQTSIINWQADRIAQCALQNNNVSLINVTGGALKGSGLSGTLTVTGAVSDGGLCKLTVTGWGKDPVGNGTATGGLTTGDVIDTSSIGGATGCNGRFTLTVIDATHIDLQGTTFGGAYTSGGIGGVEGKEAYVCMNNSNGLHMSNVGFYGSSGGVNLAPASVIDATGSSGNISILNGAANTGNGALGGYRQSFANWNNSGATAPVGTIIDIPGTPPFRNDGTKFTTSGCSVSATAGGPTGGTLTSGTTGTCTVVVTMNGATGGQTAPHGWNCGNFADLTTTADTASWQTTTSTTTTATIVGTTVSGDVVAFNCVSY